MKRPFLVKGEWRVGYSPVLILSHLPPSVQPVMQGVGRSRVTGRSSGEHLIESPIRRLGVGVVKRLARGLQWVRDQDAGSAEADPEVLTVS